MRLLLSVCFILLISSNHLLANEITLEEHYKVLETFSGDIENKESFHIITVKNKETKMYELIPVSFFNNILVRLASISFKKKPSIRSYHSNNNKITLLVTEGTSYPINKMALDINMETGENYLSKVITTNNLKATLRKADKSFLITNHFNDLKIIRIDDASNMSIIDLVKDKQNASFLKRIPKSLIGAVNTDEFVKNGSIGSFKVYCDKDDVLYLTKDDFLNRLTSVISLKTGSNREKNNITVREFKYDIFRTVKEVSSYFHENKLYQFLLNKDVGYIKINDLNTGTSKSITLDNDKMNFSIKGENFIDLKSFLKEANKNKFKSTITVNKSLGEELIIRCDYVDSITYGYNYNWWWHHQQFMMHQQMHMNSLPSFGPNNSFPDFYFDTVVENKKHYFEIVIDKDFNVIDNKEIAPKFQYINKKKHTKIVDDNESLKHVSTVFLDDLFVYFYFDSNSNSFKISNKSILDD